MRRCAKAPPPPADRVILKVEVPEPAQVIVNMPVVIAAVPVNTPNATPVGL
jgi:hypothetical protein